MNLNIASIGVGIGAGLASALLLAFAFVLLWLSPLPLLIAGFGWGFGAALVGGVIASIALGSVTTYAFGLTFFLGIAGPSALLALVVMLARPAEESADPDVRAAGGYEWFPVGDIVALPCEHLGHNVPDAAREREDVRNLAVPRRER